MDDCEPWHTLDSVPDLFALHRAEDGDEPAAVVAWGLAFPDGSAVTLWTRPYLGVATGVGTLEMVEQHHACNVGADLVWLTGPEAQA
ncbi:MAG: hypothetical protein ACRDTX_27865 [Pseudonocardiaceae bacterium]